jgi:hypothetical protein
VRVSQFLIFVPVLMQVSVSLLVTARYWQHWLSGGFDEVIADCYRAQFEMPVLFYGAALSAFALRIVDERFLFFAALFAFAEGVGAVALLAFSNKSLRASSSLAAALAAAALWGIIALHFVFSGF